MIDELRNKCETLIKQNADERLLIIREILKIDECFINMTIEDAYQILLDLKYDIKECKDIYYKLIIK